MTALIVVACITLPLAWLLTRKIRLTAQYRNAPSLYASLLFYKYHIYPPKEKAKPEKPAKKEKPVRKQEGGEQAADIKELIELAAYIIKAVYSKTLGYIRIKLARVRIRVGTDDAAHTALLYGIIAQSAAYLIDVLDRITNVYTKDVSVDPDFTAPGIRADISVEVSVRVWQALHLAILAVMEYLQVTGKRKKEKEDAAGNK